MLRKQKREVSLQRIRQAITSAASFTKNHTEGKGDETFAVCDSVNNFNVRSHKRPFGGSRYGDHIRYNNGRIQVNKERGLEKY